MEIKILKETPNKLFKRKEVLGVIISNIAPSHEEVFKILAKKFSTNEENIKIKKISGKFGSKNFEILTNIYESKKDKDVVEIKKKREIEKDKKIAEEKKAKEKSVEEVKEEKVEVKE